MPAIAGAGLDKARNQEVNQGLLTWVAGTQQPEPISAASLQAGISGVEQDWNTDTPVWDGSVPSGILTARPTACFRKLVISC